MLRNDSENFSELLIYFSVFIIAEWIYYFIFAIVQNRHISLEMIAFALSSVSLFVTASVSPSKTKTQFVAIIAGIMMQIAFCELLPTSKKYNYKKLTIIFFIIGILFMLLKFLI